MILRFPSRPPVFRPPVWLGAAVLPSVALLVAGLIVPPRESCGQESPSLPVSPAVSGEAAAPAPEQEAFREPADVVQAAIGDPPAGKRISREGRLWVDLKGKRVIVDGYVAMERGPLEMFACPAQTKEHESVVAVLAAAHEVHAALLAIGAQSGTPVSFSPNFVPPTGQRIRVWVLWRDAAGKVQTSDAKRWVQKTGTQQHLQLDWVFTGSRYWTDPSDGKRYYEADSGDLICVSNFGSAMMDLPTKSSQETGNLQFVAYADRVPPQLTPVRLILVPIPVPSDDPVPRPAEAADPAVPPSADWLPRPAAKSPQGAPNASAEAAAEETSGTDEAASAGKPAAENPPAPKEGS